MPRCRNRDGSDWSILLQLFWLLKIGFLKRRWLRKRGTTREPECRNLLVQSAYKSKWYKLTMPWDTCLTKTNPRWLLLRARSTMSIHLQKTYSGLESPNSRRTCYSNYLVTITIDYCCFILLLVKLEGPLSFHANDVNDANEPPHYSSFLRVHAVTLQPANFTHHVVLFIL